MGLFGRDDKSSKVQPESATPSPRSTPSTPAAPSTGGAARTTVARGSLFDGTLSGGADIVIEGEVKGVVDGSAGLLIAESGRVVAAVHARHVTVAGTVKGDVSADERIQLEPSAHVQGNITSPRILIKEGATFDGKVEMKAPAKREKTPGTSAPEPAPHAAKNGGRGNGRGDGKSGPQGDGKD